MTTIDLLDTNASKISSALIQARRRTGSRTVGVVLTLVIIAEESTYEDALHSAAQAAREHPSRILVVIPTVGRGKSRLDAEIRIGGLSPGDTIVLRMHGSLARHVESVVLPLLLSDNPVVAWWPGKAPECPGDEPIGRLAQRRITDAAAVPRPSVALRHRAVGYTPGDTDLAWTRLTPWRALLAAALDQHVTKVYSAAVEGERNNPSVDILAAWLQTRLGVEVTRRVSKGPGLTGAELQVSAGHIRISRPDGRLAMLDIPGSPTRPVGLRRRERFELLAEEMRRLDPDDIYELTVARFAPDEEAPAAKVTGASARRTAKETKAAAKKAASSTAASRRTAAKKSAAQDTAKRTSAKKAAEAAAAAAKKAAAQKAAAKKAAERRTQLRKEASRTALTVDVS